MHSGLVPVLSILFILTLHGSSVAVATEKIADQEAIECLVCHADGEESSETLTDQGLYYEYLRTLEDFDLVLERFESCTYCHVEQAGTKSLTAQGHRFRWMMEDMAGLRAWLEEYHPRSDGEDEQPGEAD